MLDISTQGDNALYDQVMGNDFLKTKFDEAVKHEHFGNLRQFIDDFFLYDASQLHHFKDQFDFAVENEMCG